MKQFNNCLPLPGYINKGRWCELLESWLQKSHISYIWCWGRIQRRSLATTLHYGSIDTSYCIINKANQIQNGDWRVSVSTSRDSVVHFNFTVHNNFLHIYMNLNNCLYIVLDCIDSRCTHTVLRVLPHRRWRCGQNVSSILADMWETLHPGTLLLWKETVGGGILLSINR